jgi:hypothetical protein
MGGMRLTQGRYDEEDDEDKWCTGEAFDSGSEDGDGILHHCMRCGGAIADGLHFRGDDADEFPVMMSVPRESSADKKYKHAQVQSRLRDERQYRRERMKNEYAAQKKAIDKRVDQSKHAHDDWVNGVKGAKAPGGVKSKPKAKGSTKANVLSGLKSMGFGSKK